MASSVWAMVLAAAALVALGGRAAALPEGFEREFVTNLAQVLDMEFLPAGGQDKFVLVGQQFGEILIGDVSQTPVQFTTYLSLVLETDAAGEKGLVDIALDPDFELNNFIYVFYCRNSKPGPGTTPGDSCRVSRFEHKGMFADKATETVIWLDTDGYPVPEDQFPYDHHYGGQMGFGPDGLLYIATGDKAVKDAAQLDNTYHGCVVRVDKEGNFPAGNIGKAPAEGCWVLGLRNGFRAAWDLPTGRFFIGETGGNLQEISQEDIHVLTVNSTGVNLGWPACEGNCKNSNFPTCDCALHDDPLYTYAHNGNNAALIGGLVYRSPTYPSEYDGVYFYGDFSRNWIEYLSFDSNGNPTAHEFDDKTGGVVGFQVSPEGFLYYYARAGQVYRYEFFDPDRNQPPQISGTSFEIDQLQVTFTVEAHDPEEEGLTYEWDFGDGVTAPPTTSPVISHVYSQIGAFAARVVVVDAFGNTRLAPDIRFQLGEPPSVAIISPLDGASFQAGDNLTFSANATDVAGTALDGSAFFWTIELLHDDHTHPIGNFNGRGTFVIIPTDGHGWTGDTGYIFHVRAADQFGLEAEATATVRPRKVDLAFFAEPCGRAVVSVDGAPYRPRCPSPFVTDTMVGFRHHIVADERLCQDGTTYLFDKWVIRDAVSGATTQEVLGFDAHITVPTIDSDVVATYTARPELACIGRTLFLDATGLVLQLDAAQGVSGAGSNVDAWADQASSSSRVFAPSAAPAPPASASFTAVQQPNGLTFPPAFVRITGLDAALESSDLAGLPGLADDRTVYLVARNAAAATSGSGGGFAWDRFEATAGATGGWQVQAVVWTAGVQEVYADGVLQSTLPVPGGQSGTGGSATAAGEPAVLGATAAGQTAGLEVAEVLVYDVAHAAALVEGQSDFLLAKHFKPAFQSTTPSTTPSTSMSTTPTTSMSTTATTTADRFGAYPGVSHLGCYVDIDSPRDFEVGPIMMGDLTPHSCAARCLSEGNYRFFGLQFAFECWCGDSPQSYPRVPASDCASKCSGDKSLSCGGAFRNNVFSIDNPELIPAAEPINPYPGYPGLRHVGCVENFEEARSFEVGPLFDPTGMDPGLCALTCKDLGFRYSGVEFSTECWCTGTGDDEVPFNAAETCTYPCSGDPSAFCGGLHLANAFILEDEAALLAGPGRAALDFLGCFNDEGRTFSAGPLGTGVDGMTNTECAAICASRGFDVSATQYGAECWCATFEDWDRGKKVGRAKCDIPCEGDGSDTCGGFFRATVNLIVRGLDSTSSSSSSSSTSTSAAPTTTAACELEGCAQCDARGEICLECDEGLRVKRNGKCGLDCGVAGCQFCRGDGSRCLRCDDGLRLQYNGQACLFQPDEPFDMVSVNATGLGLASFRIAKAGFKDYDRDFAQSCSSSGADTAGSSDTTILWRAPASRTYNLNTAGSAIPTVISVARKNGRELACGTCGRCGLNFKATKGRQYAVVVSGYGGLRGRATLNVVLKADAPCQDTMPDACAAACDGGAAAQDTYTCPACSCPEA